MKRIAVPCLALALAACGSQETDDTPPAVKQAQTKALTPKTASRADQPIVEDGDVTPNEDRIATLGLLNKRNNLTQDVVLNTGESRRVGNVTLKLESCERTAPWEAPEEEGAFVQVFVNEQRPGAERTAWRKVFSGWLFKNSPALNVVEHPIYDVWVKDCAMRYPGESASPAPEASPSNAENASGSESGA